MWTRVAVRVCAHQRAEENLPAGLRSIKHSLSYLVTNSGTTFLSDRRFHVAVTLRPSASNQIKRFLSLRRLLFKVRCEDMGGKTRSRLESDGPSRPFTSHNSHLLVSPLGRIPESLCLSDNHLCVNMSVFHRRVKRPRHSCET
ncbi:hypothetical protein F2P81_025240 [Scophthalmus maximus]|uniref:Uncharacterized protein n=1 Tax=Scophthalmus maximus TaxID=52904 RepID=A0A6A4RVS9_SCOMX|nr:hypothetical protein F2P81_025240 [Scophthalmus maximus]